MLTRLCKQDRRHKKHITQANSKRLAILRMDTALTRRLNHQFSSQIKKTWFSCCWQKYSCCREIFGAHRTGTFYTNDKLLWFYDRAFVDKHCNGLCHVSDQEHRCHRYQNQPCSWRIWWSTEDIATASVGERKATWALRQVPFSIQDGFFGQITCLLTHQEAHVDWTVKQTNSSSFDLWDNKASSIRFYSILFLGWLSGSHFQEITPFSLKKNEGWTQLILIIS